jgi:hypothetical protein
MPRSTNCDAPRARGLVPRCASAAGRRSYSERHDRAIIGSRVESNVSAEYLAKKKCPWFRSNRQLSYDGHLGQPLWPQTGTSGGATDSTVLRRSFVGDISVSAIGPNASEGRFTTVSRPASAASHRPLSAMKIRPTADSPMAATPTPITRAPKPGLCDPTK